jgi:two-component system, OmpR family, sensor histidine kinase KdpD
VKLSRFRKLNIGVQLGISLGLIALIAVPSYFVADLIGYRVVALLLLLAVSVLAMLFEFIPVLITAVVSALAWNFFFIPPIFTFHIGEPEDALMALMYIAVALINVVLTTKIRQFEKDSRDKEERENTIRLYNTLLNSLSHELRTPISTIIGAADTIRESEEKLSEKQRRELITEIGIAGSRLNRQVENLLNMSRLESGTLKLKRDWCDVNELIYSIIEESKSVAMQHEIVFTPNEKLPLFRLDRGLLEQVIKNILHNAVQHTPAGTRITIQARQQSNVCILELSDNGPGFPENEIQNVFEKFYRLPNSNTGGTGLGLSIAKGYVAAHGGTIKLANAPARGAIFTIHIPAEASTIKLQS